MGEAGGGDALRGAPAAAFYLRELLSGPPRANEEVERPLRRGGPLGGYGSGESLPGGGRRGSAGALSSVSSVAPAQSLAKQDEGAAW